MPFRTGNDSILHAWERWVTHIEILSTGATRWQIRRWVSLEGWIVGAQCTTREAAKAALRLLNGDA